MPQHERSSESLEAHREEPPSLVAEAWESCDIFIAPTKYSLSNTRARKAANQAGARGATMPTITTAMFKTGAITADYSKVSSLCERMGALMDKASEARVTSGAGTDITMSIMGRLKGRDTGLLRKPGDFGNLPAGEVYVAPLEGTAEGTLVFDGTIASVGVLKKPVVVTVKDGWSRSQEVQHAAELSSEEGSVQRRGARSRMQPQSPVDRQPSRG